MGQAHVEESHCVICDRRSVNKENQKERDAGLRYCSGVQNGTTSIAKHVPKIDTEMVDTRMAESTAGNCKDKKRSKVSEFACSYCILRQRRNK